MQQRRAAPAARVVDRVLAGHENWRRFQDRLFKSPRVQCCYDKSGVLSGRTHAPPRSFFTDLFFTHLVYGDRMSRCEIVDRPQDHECNSRHREPGHSLTTSLRLSPSRLIQPARPTGGLSQPATRARWVSLKRRPCSKIGRDDRQCSPPRLVMQLSSWLQSAAETIQFGKRSGYKGRYRTYLRDAQ